MTIGASPSLGQSWHMTYHWKVFFNGYPMVQSQFFESWVIAMSVHQWAVHYYMASLIRQSQKLSDC